MLPSVLLPHHAVTTDASQSALRYSRRRTQPREAEPRVLLHTSQAVTEGRSAQLPREYLVALQDVLYHTQARQDAWAGEVHSLSEVLKEATLQETRRVRNEADVRAATQREEHRALIEARNEARRLHAAEEEQRQRQELERLHQEREEASRRRREEEEAAEEARWRAVYEAENQRREQQAAAEEAERQLRVEQAAAEQAQRRAVEEAERQRRESSRDCAVCLDSNDVDTMSQTPCHHWYCRTCLRDGFEASFASQSRFQCCQQYVPVNMVSDLLRPEFVAGYDLMVLEQTTPSPTYCATAACGAFIPPSSYHGPDAARCNQCGSETCRHCRTRDHPGRGCTADEATQQVRALAAITGWKICPTCSTMVERRDGCRHMTCHCGEEFCYRCGGFWRLCMSRCEGRYF